MPLRELLALFGIQMDDKQLKKANKTISATVGRLKTLGGMLVGGFVIRGISNFISAQIREADVLAKTADKLGLTTDELQELRFAAQQAGVQQSSLDVGIQRFTRRAAEAAAGTGEAKKTLHDLGIELTDAQGVVRPTSELLVDVADALAQTSSQADRVRIAFKLFDTEGVALVNMLRDGGESLMAMRRRFQELGGGISEEFARAAEEATNQLGELDVVVTGLKSQLVLALLPTLRRVVGGIIRFGRKIQEATRGTDFMERAIRVLKVALVATGLAITIAFAKPIALFLVFAALVVAVALAVDDLVTAFEGGESVIGSFIDETYGLGTTRALVEKLQAAWDSFTGAAEEGGVTWKDVIRGIVWVFTTWFGMLLDMIQLPARISAAWDLASAEVRAVWGLAMIDLLSAVETVEAAFRNTTAAIGQFFSDLWQQIVQGFRVVVDNVIRQTRRLPGVGLVADAFGATGGPAVAAAGRVMPIPQAAGGANLVQRNNVQLTVVTPTGAPQGGVVQTLRRQVLRILAEDRRAAIAALEQAGGV